MGYPIIYSGYLVLNQHLNKSTKVFLNTWMKNQINYNYLNDIEVIWEYNEKNNSIAINNHFHGPFCLIKQSLEYLIDSVIKPNGYFVERNIEYKAKNNSTDGGLLKCVSNNTFIVKSH
jgi:hypothetical protein